MSTQRNSQLANLPAMNNGTLILTIDSAGGGSTILFNKLATEADSDYGVVLDPNEVTGLLFSAGDPLDADLALSIGTGGGFATLVIASGQSLYLPVYKGSPPLNLRFAHVAVAPAVGGFSSVMVFSAPSNAWAPVP